MDILYEVYKTAMSYMMFIFQVFISMLGFLLVCCFIVEKNYRIRDKCEGGIRGLKEIKEDHIKMLKKNKVKETL